MVPSTNTGTANKMKRQSSVSMCSGAGICTGAEQLGVMYYHGNGIKQDFDEAFKWYRCAAEQGHAKAPNSLGVMYYTGGWCAARLRKLVAAGSRAR